MCISNMDTFFFNICHVAVLFVIFYHIYVKNALNICFGHFAFYMHRNLYIYICTSVIWAVFQEFFT